MRCAGRRTSSLSIYCSIVAMFPVDVEELCFRWSLDKSYGRKLDKFSCATYTLRH